MIAQYNNLRQRKAFLASPELALRMWELSHILSMLSDEDITSLYESRLNESAAGTIRSGDFQGKRILVVEDNNDTADTVRGLLEDAGAEVEVARHGDEAMDLLMAASFDMVLTDFHLPVIDGLELTRQIKEYEPDMLVVIWSEIHPSREQEAAAAGLGAEFLEKSSRIIPIIQEALAHTGGIDLRSDNALQIRNDGQNKIRFKIDPATLERLRDAPGFTPVIINITPMTDLKAFLGLSPTAQSGLHTVTA